MNPDDEDDRTVVRPTGAGGSTGRVTQGATRSEPAPSSSTPQHTHTLPNGTRLGEFELTETLGEGGFGIVYLAWDHSLDRKVALKEYMPSAIAFRVGQTEIRPRSERHQETFEAGMKSFINEAKLLAQFDHPALVKVYRFWEAHGTAYMVMPFYEGITVRDAVRKLPEPPDEAWILALLEPLFHALTMLHASQCFHRDIAPDNIMLLAPNERPLLLDFGAARRVIGDMTQALTAILKPGYAPVEQYAEVPGLKQGPWTDVYALAAVVHWIVTGKTPPASVGRMFGDSYVPLAERLAGRYSPSFLAAIDRALVVLPDKRTSSIDAFRQEMTTSGGAAVQGVPRPAAPVRADAPMPRTESPPASTAHTEWPATVEVPPASPEDAGQVPKIASAASDLQRTLPPRPRAPAAASVEPSRKRWLIPAVIAGLVIAAGIAAVMWSSRTPAPALSQPTPPVAPPPVAATPQPPGVAQPPVVPAPPVAEAKPPAAEGPALQEVAPAAVTAEPPAAIVAPPATDPRPATTRRPAPQKPPAGEARTAEPRAADPTEPRPERRTEPRSEPRTAEPRSGGSEREAECARLFARLSLGENNQDLIDRVKTLRCR